LQALISLNDESAIEFAESLAARILKEGGADDASRIRYGWLLTLSREPRAEETERMLRFLRTRRDSKDDDRAAWVAASRVMLNIDEFLTRE
jgi:hypothetical protein